MGQRLDIDALRALHAIATQGGVTRAADVLSLSQSAVSHKIKRLEDSLGSPLLNRKPGMPLLTETGERLLGYGNRILSLHDEALAALGQRQLSGQIRLGITEDTTSQGLASILGRFSRLFPNIDVETYVAQSLNLQADIEAGKIDLAVMQVFARDIVAGDAVLDQEQLHWVKALDFDLPEDGKIPFLAFDDDCFYKHWMMEHGTSDGRAFKCVMRCSSNSGIVAAVEAGLGVTILNQRYITPRMAIIHDTFVAPPDIAYVVRSAKRQTSNAVRSLADEIARETRMGLAA